MLPVEYEKVLKRFERYERVNSNAYQVDEEVEEQCLMHLLRKGYIDLVYSDEETEMRGYPHDRYQRTYLGISYFKDKRRRWLMDNSGSLITGAFSLASLIVGVIIGAII